ncbi:MAG TPA: MarR family transcriptional regulator [Streptosporangiaceae bacterium]|nr:MarR family transcriptional regulator [Streptosporangiaceae bacterium]
MSKRQSAGIEADQERAELVERLNMAGREVSAATIMFHTALAQRRGLSAIEEKTLDILLRDGPLTHAGLVAATGLAPASVTGLIDRLEDKGYARRSAHPGDARRILVTADADRIAAELTPLFGPWTQSLSELYATYTTGQLETICDFMTRAAARQRDAAAELAVPADDRADRRNPAGRSGRRDGRRASG